MAKNKTSNGLSERASDIILVVITAIVLFIVAYPLYYVLVASFSNPYDVYAGKTFLLPSQFTLDGYKAVFADPNIPTGYLNSIPFGFNENSRGVGVADMAYAIRDGREMRASKERVCHVLDVQECMVKSHERNGVYVDVETTCVRSAPLTVPTDGEESSLR